jgi:hypothetical protein
MQNSEDQMDYSRESHVYIDTVCATLELELIRCPHRAYARMPRLSSSSKIIQLIFVVLYFSLMTARTTREKTFQCFGITLLMCKCRNLEVRAIIAKVADCVSRINAKFLHDDIL